MKKIIAWQGDTIPLKATQPDDTAVSATLLIGELGEVATFTKTASFVSGEADLTITEAENVQGTIPIGEYKYMVQVAYTDDKILTFPNPSDCKELPEFEIRQRIG